jgi:hypothetical protein
VRKTFQLHIEGKNPERVLEATKHEIRKYIKRQGRVPLPEGAHYWDFDCRFGPSKEQAEVVHLSAIIGLIDTLAKQGGAAFYLELLAKAGQRRKREGAEVSQTASDTGG